MRSLTGPGTHSVATHGIGYRRVWLLGSVHPPVACRPAFSGSWGTSLPARLSNPEVVPRATPPAVCLVLVGSLDSCCAARILRFMDRTCEEKPTDEVSDEEDPDSTEAPARIRDTPEDIVLEAPASGLAFHPARDLLAAGDVDGDVFV